MAKGMVRWLAARRGCRPKTCTGVGENGVGGNRSLLNA